MEAAQCLERILLADDAGEAAAGNVDARVARGQVERLHRLAVQHRRVPLGLGLLPAHRQHVGGAVHPLDRQPGLQVTAQQPARAAGHIESQAARLLDDAPVEVVIPGRFVVGRPVQRRQAGVHVNFIKCHCFTPHITSCAATR